MFTVTARSGGVLALLAAATLALSACGGGGTSPSTATDSPAAGGASGSSGSTDASSSPGGSAGDLGECAEVLSAMTSWVNAAFAGASTEITNGELADTWDAVVVETKAVPDPGGEQWGAHIQVIEKYAAEWRALPADGVALENIETVEATVDEYAASIGYDNDAFDDLTPIVGEHCNEVITAYFDE